jgi:hypothetical protein
MVIEGSTPQEVAEMLALMGFPGLSELAEARVVRNHHRVQARLSAELVYSHWTPEAVRELLSSLPEQTRRFLVHLILMGDLTVAMAAQHLNLADSKPIGSMLASIRRRAEQMRLPNPVLSEVGDDESVRHVRLELPFRDAATRQMRGEP